MKLAVISHTEHFYNKDGILVGWGPTVTELNHLLTVFEEIYHISVLCDVAAPKSAISYCSDKIHFIPLKKAGGKGLKNKFDILSQIPDVIKKVKSTLKLVDYFQLRTPTAMGVYLIPYLTLFHKKKGWYKYAGNWKQKKAPLGFAFQRWLLKHQSRKVTINGEWESQPSHCISFENPCLTATYRKEGAVSIEKKTMDGKINFCFVGTFYKRKGIDLILSALENFESDRLGTFYFIGGGDQMQSYQEWGATIKATIKFKGFLPKEQINEIYKYCHFIVLPSNNEGFPKVIGEAMNYGCIPIVSDVSCLGQYILNRKNGYIIDPLNATSLLAIFEACILLNKSSFEEMIQINFNLAEKFTYEYYHKQLKSKILSID